MPYIGNNIRAADDYRLIDDISSSFNGSTTSFALQIAGSSPVPFPKSPQQCLISVNGVIQEPDPTGASGFNLVGTNIVFSSAPTNGHAFFGIVYATADYLNAGGTFPAGSTGSPSITFTTDQDTGLYRKGSGSIGFVSNSTEIANVDSNGITSTQFIGGGANITGIAAGNIASGTIASASLPTLNQDTTGTAAIATTITVADESSDTGCNVLFATSASGNLGAKTGSNLTFNSSTGLLTATAFSGSGASLTGVLSDIVEDTSPQLGGNLDTNSFEIDLDDGHGVRFKNGSGTIRLQAYVSGGNGYLQNSEGDLLIETIGSADDIILTSVDDIQLKPQGGENGIQVIGNGGVELYHNNSKHFETSAYGVFVTGGANGNFGSHTGGTVTFDLASSAYHFVNMNANSTFAAPINAQIGHSGSIFLIQDGTGGRTGSFNSAFKFVGGTAPTLSTAANAVDRLDFIVEDDSPLKVHIAVSLDVK